MGQGPLLECRETVCVCLCKLLSNLKIHRIGRREGERERERERGGGGGGGEVERQRGGRKRKIKT